MDKCYTYRLPEAPCSARPALLVRMFGSRQPGARVSGTVGEFFGGSGRRIRDVIWGDVPTDRSVGALLETKAMRRLGSMSQLGLTFAAFPRARHTRLDHAIGTYHLASLTLKRIVDTGAYLEDRDVRGALAAALLLNAGRYPYSGAIEGISLPGAPTFKELSRRWIEHTDVAKVLRSDWDLEPHNVFRLVSRGDTPPRGLTPTEHLLRDILFGPLNVDGLDSLIRDGRGARVPFGLVETLPLIEHLRIVGQENRAVLTLDEEGAGSLQSLVFSRYLIHSNVYGHHALRIPTVMLLRAVQDAVQDGTVTFDKLSEQDDAGAFVLLEASSEPESATAVLMKRLADRAPYHLALQFDERHPGGWQSLSGMSTDDSTRFHAPLRRITIATANEELTTSVRRHADELFTIAREVG